MNKTVRIVLVALVSFGVSSSAFAQAPTVAPAPAPGSGAPAAAPTTTPAPAPTFKVTGLTPTVLVSNDKNETPRKVVITGSGLTGQGIALSDGTTDLDVTIVDDVNGKGTRIEASVKIPADDKSEYMLKVNDVEQKFKLVVKNSAQVAAEQQARDIKAGAQAAKDLARMKPELDKLATRLNAIHAPAKVISESDVDSKIAAAEKRLRDELTPKIQAVDDKAAATARNTAKLATDLDNTKQDVVNHAINLETVAGALKDVAGRTVGSLKRHELDHDAAERAARIENDMKQFRLRWCATLAEATKATSANCTAQ